MVKDVTNSALQTIQVEYTPAVIKIDREAIERQVEAAVSKYSGKEVTAENYKEVFSERTDYNKLIEALDNERKKIKNSINQPYKEFEAWFKEKALDPLKQVTETMKSGLDAIDEHEKELRLDIIRATFEQKSELAGIDKDFFKDKYEAYSLKKYFKTGKYELKKETLEEIDSLVLTEYDRLEEEKANKQAIHEQAEEYALPAESYIRHLEAGKSLVEILKMMKADRDAEVLRKEQREAAEKAKAERLAEINQLAKENAEAEIKAYNADTGEIIESGTITPRTQNEGSEELKTASNEPLTVTMLLTLHGGQEQLEKLKEYLDDNFISYGILGGQ